MLTLERIGRVKSIHVSTMDATTVVYQVGNKLLVTYDRFSSLSQKYITEETLQILQEDPRRNVLIVDVKKETNRN